MSGTLVPMGTEIPAATHQNLKIGQLLGNRYRRYRTEDISEVEYRCLPKIFQKMGKIFGYRWVPRKFQTVGKIFGYRWVPRKFQPIGKMFGYRWVPRKFQKMG